MAAAILDIDINEKETFEMAIEFWDNTDLTEPIDISGWAFNGAFKFSSACIQMSFITVDNSVSIRVEASELVDLPSKGSYTIEANSGSDTYRIQQGKVEVDRSIVCS